MSNSAKSIYIFSIYMIGLGLSFLLIPNTIMNTLGFQETDEVWTRVVGMLVLILAFYYIQAARHELTAFFQATVYGRCSVIVFFTVFVLLDLAPAVLILMSVPDVLGAVWTEWTLRSVRD